MNQQSFAQFTPLPEQTSRFEGTRDLAKINETITEKASADISEKNNASFSNYNQSEHTNQQAH